MGKLTSLSVPESLLEQILAINIFLKSAGGLSFVEQFIDVGGPLALLDIIALKQAPDNCKTCAIQCLINLADRGIRYKAILCESNCIKIVTECLARSDDEYTRVEARELLLELGTTAANKKWSRQVYIAFIALLASRSPRANHLAIGALKILQPIIGEVVPGIVEPLLNLLETPHLEVLLEVCVFIEQLICSNKEKIHVVNVSQSVRNSILSGLVDKLRPRTGTDNFFGNEVVGELNSDKNENSDSSVGRKQSSAMPIPVLLGQAGSARCINMLIEKDIVVAKELLGFDVIKNLMFSAGSPKSSESRRMAFKALENYCRLFEPIRRIVQAGCGPKLFSKFENREDCWTELDHVDTDILLNNRASISEAEIKSMKL